MTRQLTIALIGRTQMLLEAGKRAVDKGHRIGLVASCKHAGHEGVCEQDFADFAKSMQAPFLMHHDLTSAHGLATIAAAKCDLALSMNWLTLIPARLRNLFPMGIFNAHPGDLPRFKGNACPNWAILMGEKHIALTIHAMVDALDSGPIADKSYFELENADITDVYAWLQTSIPEGFLRIIEAACLGTLALQPQPDDPSLGLRCYPRRPEDGKIDWSKPVEDVLRLIRASSHPFDGAYSFLNSERKLKIWKAVIEETSEPFVAVPGQIAYSMAGDPVVAGINGYLRLTQITLESGPSDEQAPQIVNSAGAKAAVLSSLRNRLT